MEKTPTTFEDLAQILYRDDVDSIPSALKVYIKQLRQTDSIPDNLHASTLEYYLRTFENKTLFRDLRKSFNDIYDLIERDFPYIRFKIDGRRKSLISTEKKILANLENNVPLDSMKDFLGVRILIICNDGKTNPEYLVKSCYRIMELIINHLVLKRYTLCEAKKISKTAYTKKEIYIPEKSYLSPQFEGYVKDYIKYPKAVGYQSLHSAFRFPGSNDMFELQIRTFDMDIYATSGEANHDEYKKRIYGETCLERDKIHIPGYAVTFSGILKDLIGLEEGFPIITRSKSF